MAAMATILVRVTRADIDEGWRQSCRRCPVALALLRATGLEWHADLDDLRLIGVPWEDRDRRPVRTPERVRDWMNRFDFCKSRRSQRPFRFTVNMPLDMLLAVSVRG